MYSLEDYLNAAELDNLTGGYWTEAWLPDDQNRVDRINDELPDHPEEILQDLGKNWDMIVSYMDDEIRESIHNEIAPCSNGDFLLAYCKAHSEKYDEDFSIV